MEKLIEIRNTDMHPAGKIFQRQSVSGVLGDDLDGLVYDLIFRMVGRKGQGSGFQTAVLQQFDQKNFQKSFRVVMAVGGVLLLR